MRWGRTTPRPSALDEFRELIRATRPVEPHHGDVRRCRTWCPTRLTDVLAPGWRWTCSCRETATADTRVKACNAYWDHYNRRTAA